MLHIKVRTGLQWAAIFPIVLAAVVAVSLLQRHLRAQSVGEDWKRMEEILVAVEELERANGRVLSSRETAAQEAWQQASDRLEEILSRAAPDGDPQQILQRMRGLHADVAGVISRLDAGPADAGRAEELSQKMRGLTAEALRLARASQLGAAEMQRSFETLTVVLVAMLGLLMAGVVLVTSRRIMDRMGLVRAGIRQVTQGDLDREIAMRGDDEWAALAREFNAMMRTLRENEAALRREIQEQKRGSEVLRSSNMKFSDAVIRLRRAQQQVVQQERLQALKQIVAGMAHDFNDSLMPILGTSDYLLYHRQPPLEEGELLDCLRTIHEASKKLTLGVRRLSDFFRPGAAQETESLDLNTVVTDAINVTKPQWQGRADLVGKPINVMPVLQRIPLVEANRADLQEAVIHLIVNAVEAMPEGGTVTLRTAPEEQWVLLEVSDTGRGMTDAVRRQCLEPFFSTKGNGAGGMGLTVISGIVQRHGGALGIVSAEGKGTTVSLRIPVCRQAPLPGSEPPSVEAKQRMRPLKILAVDDQPWIGEFLLRYLGSQGHTVQVADSGAAAWEKFQHMPFDLVITDMAMPEMTGKELARRIKERNPSLPIILLTGFGSMIEDEGGTPADIDVVLGKPVAPAALLKALEQAVKG